MTEEQLKMIEARCDGVETEVEETEVEEWYRVKELIALARFALKSREALEFYLQRPFLVDHGNVARAALEAYPEVKL